MRDHAVQRQRRLRVAHLVAIYIFGRDRRDQSQILFDFSAEVGHFIMGPLQRQVSLVLTHLRVAHLFAQSPLVHVRLALLCFQRCQP